MESIFGATISVLVAFECQECEKRFKIDDDGLPIITSPHLCGEFGVSPPYLPVHQEIPTRWIGEQHVKEDLNCIPAATDWLRQIQPEPWMNRARNLSKELEEVEVPK